RQGLAYVPEDRLRQGLCRGLSIRVNLVLAMLRQLAVGGLLMRRPEIRRTQAAVQTLGVRLRSIEQAIGTLSGGNQQKIVVGRWLERQPNVLILDEPTRGIDVAAKAEIHALIRRLAAEGRAIVLISSDLPEVLSQSDRVGVFRQGRLAGLFDPRQHSANEVAAAALPSSEEIRNPKSEIRKKHETGKSKSETKTQFVLRFGIRIWDFFRISDFGFRILPFREAGLFVLLLFLFAVQFWHSGRIGHLPSLATDAALLSFCALGAMLVLLVGGIDISLGSLMALSAGIAGQMWEKNYPFALVLLTGVAVGGLGGFVNAAVSLIGRVHPIVVTLGTLSLYRGMALWWLTQDVQIPGATRNRFVEPIAGLSALVWLGLGIALLTGFFL